MGELSPKVTERASGAFLPSQAACAASSPKGGAKGAAAPVRMGEPRRGSGAVRIRQTFSFSVMPAAGASGRPPPTVDVERSHEPGAPIGVSTRTVPKGALS